MKFFWNKFISGNQEIYDNHQIEKQSENHDADEQEKIEVQENGQELPQSLETNNISPALAMQETSTNNQIYQEQEAHDLNHQTESQITMNLISQLTSVLEESKKLNRQYYLNTSTIQENSEKVESLNNNLQYTQREFVEWKKYLEEISMKQRQEKGELIREIKRWQETAIEFFQLLERALYFENDENKRLIEKILSEYARILSLRGLDRIIPQSGEPLSEKHHKAIAEEVSDIESGNITRCERWGYKIGSEVLEKAEVLISKLSMPENEQTIMPSPGENINFEVVTAN